MYDSILFSRAVSFARHVYCEATFLIVGFTDRSEYNKLFKLRDY